MKNTAEEMVQQINVPTDGEIEVLSGVDLDKRIDVLEAELATLYKKRDGEPRPVHVWTPGQLPGGVKIHSCPGDASHEAHWERV